MPPAGCLGSADPLREGPPGALADARRVARSGNEATRQGTWVADQKVRVTRDEKKLGGKGAEGNVGGNLLKRFDIFATWEKLPMVIAGMLIKLQTLKAANKPKGAIRLSLIWVPFFLFTKYP